MSQPYLPSDRANPDEFRALAGEGGGSGPGWQDPGQAVFALGSGWLRGQPAARPGSKGLEKATQPGKGNLGLPSSNGETEGRGVRAGLFKALHFSKVVSRLEAQQSSFPAPRRCLGVGECRCSI